MRGQTVKTPELVAEATRLRGEGLMWREIGARLGISHKTACQWVNDPDGQRMRARKDSYATACVDCGATVSGSDGPREHPRCLACAAADRAWSRGEIVAAIVRWNDEHGVPPTARQWTMESASWRPVTNTVVRVFGSWNAGIAAAGFEPLRPGHKRGDRRQRVSA